MRGLVPGLRPGGVQARGRGEGGEGGEELLLVLEGDPAVVVQLRTGLGHHVLLCLVVGRHGLLQCLGVLGHLEEVTEVGIAQQTPALAVSGVHTDRLLPLHQTLLHVADLLLAVPRRDLSQRHGEVPQ